MPQALRHSQNFRCRGVYLLQAAALATHGKVYDRRTRSCI